MTSYIWRLWAIWIGKETTSWTSVVPTAWIPFETGDVKPVIESIKDTWAYWVIDEVYDSKVTKNMSEITIWWVARSQFIWDLVMWALWTSAAPVDNTDWTYTHAFTRKNDNTPVSYTAYYDNPTWDEEATYCVFDSLEFEVNSGDYVRFTTTLKWKALKTPWTDRTPAYTDQEEFLAANAEIKFADNIAWLWAASPVILKNIKLSITKNVIDYQAIWSTDVESLHNQQFTVAWDLEALFWDTVLRDYVLNNTKKAMRITLQSSNVIWTWSQKAELQLECARISFADWGKSSDANGLVNQTMWFNWEFSAADWKTISAQLINTQSTQY